jgi:DNA repair protein SbcD/Mre11
MLFLGNRNRLVTRYGNTKMSKYIIYTDAHCKGINPKSRTDNYYQSWLEKYREMFSIAKKNKVTAIIDAGDLLDIPNVADSIVDDILDIVEEHKIPVYAMWGNHSMCGHHKETSKGTSLAHMFRRCKLFQDCGNGIEVGTDFHIDFIDYDHEIENKIKENGIIIDSKETYWKIAICHIMITPEPFFKDALYITPSEIKTNADLIICGHYHHPWQVKIGKTQFLNPGCFGRTSIDMWDIEPSVILLDTEKRSWEIIKLKWAKDGKDIFDLNKKQELENNERELEEFISQLKDFKAQEMDLVSVINQICKDNEIEKSVRDTILQKLGEVK